MCARCCASLSADSFFSRSFVSRMIFRRLVNTNRKIKIAVSVTKISPLEMLIMNTSKLSECVRMTASSVKTIQKYPISA